MIYGLALTGTTLLLILYTRRAVRRWQRVLERALEYHRYHLRSRTSDHTLGEQSREMVRVMLWVMDRQLWEDIGAGRTGLRGILLSMKGGHTSLQILGEMFYAAARFRRDVDEEIERLGSTLLCTVLRCYLIRSRIKTIFLLTFDLRLLMASVKGTREGPQALFRDLHRNDG